MRIVEINGGVFGSTGKIMFGISEALSKCGHEVFCFSPVTSTNRRKAPDHEYIKIGSYYSRRINVFFDRLFGQQNGFAWFATMHLLKRLDLIKPDVIHLHNLHGSYLNCNLLFSYIKGKKIKVVWTLHDCWAFTGECPYFDMVNCNKWKQLCGNCPQYSKYPGSFFDNTATMWKKKKIIFTGVDDLTIVTPSKWLSGLVKESFLKNYRIEVINNGIDTDIFKPEPSNFREKYKCQDKKILLGVAFDWSNRKGLDIFIKMAESFPDKFQIVLIGTTESIDSCLPENIISIHRTADQHELAQFYSMADVFVNPTREDNYPTVNLEAIACGTPVVTFNTGGSPEMLSRNTGLIVQPHSTGISADDILKGIDLKKNQQAFYRAAKNFDYRQRFQEYVDLIANV